MDRLPNMMANGTSVEACSPACVTTLAAHLVEEQRQKDRAFTAGRKWTRGFHTGLFCQMPVRIATATPSRTPTIKASSRCLETQTRIFTVMEVTIPAITVK
jgi:hypothetical protein